MLQILNRKKFNIAQSKRRCVVRHCCNQAKFDVKLVKDFKLVEEAKKTKNQKWMCGYHKWIYEAVKSRGEEIAFWRELGEHTLAEEVIDLTTDY